MVGAQNRWVADNGPGNASRRTTTTTTITNERTKRETKERDRGGGEMEREKKRNWPVGRQVTLHLTAPSPRAAASVAVRPSRRHLQPSRVTEFFYRLLPGGRPRIRSFQRPPSRSSGGVPGFYRVFSLIRWGFQSITGFCRVLIDLS